MKSDTFYLADTSQEHRKTCVIVFLIPYKPCTYVFPQRFEYLSQNVNPVALNITIGEHKFTTSKRMDILTYVLQIVDHIFYDKCMHR